MKHKIIIAFVLSMSTIIIHGAQKRNPNWGTLPNSAISLIDDTKNFDEIRPIIEKASNTGHLDDQTAMGQTLLHLVANQRIDKVGDEIAQHLINAGANTNLQDLYGDTPLHSAIHSLNGPLVVMLAHTTDLSLKDEEGRAPLALAQEMHETGADNARRLPNAARHKLLYIFRDLRVISGARSGQFLTKENTKKLIEVLERAIIAHDNQQPIKQFHHQIDILLKNADIHAKTPKHEGGFTILHLAVQTNDKDIVEKIVKAGAQTDLRTMDAQGRTPEQLAQVLGYKEIIQLLQEVEISV